MHARFFDHAGLPKRLRWRSWTYCLPLHRQLAFRYTDSVGTRNQFSIAAQWLACTFPYRRFADILADACARLGADVVRYSWRTCVKTSVSQRSTELFLNFRLSTEGASAIGFRPERTARPDRAEVDCVQFLPHCRVAKC